MFRLPYKATFCYLLKRTLYVCYCQFKRLEGKKNVPSLSKEEENFSSPPPKTVQNWRDVNGPW